MKLGKAFILSLLNTIVEVAGTSHTVSDLSSLWSRNSWWKCRQISVLGSFQGGVRDEGRRWLPGESYFPHYNQRKFRDPWIGLKIKYLKWFSYSCDPSKWRSKSSWSLNLKVRYYICLWDRKGAINVWIFSAIAEKIKNINLEWTVTVSTTRKFKI